MGGRECYRQVLHKLKQTKESLQPKRRQSLSGEWSGVRSHLWQCRNLALYSVGGYRCVYR